MAAFTIDVVRAIDLKRTMFSGDALGEPDEGFEKSFSAANCLGKFCAI